MGLHVYGRRARRRFSRQTGDQIVWAVGGGHERWGLWLTSIEHGHWQWDQQRFMWWPLAWVSDTDCGLHLASCQTLFGINEHGAPRNFMLGCCARCPARPGQPHLWNCPTLLTVLGCVDPDYWPRPVHRPLWMDDPRKANR